jgi:hypothetical protein
MLSNILFHAVADDSLKEKVAQSKVLPLIRELNHIYGLKVYAESGDFYYGSVEPETGNFMLCDEVQGFPVGRVFIYEDTFCYHTPYRSKQRGADDFDRHTYRSKKLSSLIASLKKADIPTKGEQMIKHLDGTINGAIRPLFTSFEINGKSGINGDYAHEILLALQSGKTLNDLPQSNRDLYLKYIDDYTKVDIQLETRKQGMHEMMDNCYVVGADRKGQYLIADGGCEVVQSIVMQSHKSESYCFSYKSPFKRVSSLQEYPDILSCLTMTKVRLDSEYRPWHKSLAPYGDRYIPELGISYGYHSNNTDFDMEWLCISK